MDPGKDAAAASKQDEDKVAGQTTGIVEDKPITKQAEDDESDWEELDEVLDDFSAKNKPQPQQQDQQSEPTAQTQGKDDKKSSASKEPEVDEDALLKHLEASMAELMGGGGGANTGAARGKDAGEPSGLPGNEDWNALTEELTKNGLQSADLMKLMMGEDLMTNAPTGDANDNAKPTPSTSEPTTKAGEGNKGEDKFQDTIQKTMQRMQESGEKATAAVSENDDDDMLMKMLKAMESGGLDADGAGGDDGSLDKMIMGIMEQLSNKEMLYEPLKELDDKFEPWLKENREKVTKEELEKYELQSSLVADMVSKFEEKGFTDDNPEHRAYIWERMQKMQAAGSPPEDLVSNPLPDESKIQEALSGGGEGCPQQ